MKAVIIDDEPHASSRLGNLLENYCRDTVRLAGIAGTIEEGYSIIREFNPDIVFLDIHIHPHTGFDLLNKLEERDFHLIFTTAHDNYALKAFRFSAVDYLLKPIDPDELVEAVGKVSARHHLSQRDSGKSEIEEIELLRHNLNNMLAMNKKIAIPTIHGFTFLGVQDIIRCQGAVNYTDIYTTERKKITVARTLKEFEHLLNEYNFFRVHNSHLVNMAYIKGYSKGKGGVVQMADGSEIEVSTRRKEDFLRRLGS